MRERRRIERDELIAGKYKILIKEHPECSSHRIMSVIADELGVTITCVRVSLIRTGNHTPRRKELRNDGGREEDIRDTTLE